MGMFDTIIFDRPIPCPKCGAEIRSDQTKAFECTLDEYRIGDCIAHAEEIRIVGDELYCEACKAFTDALLPGGLPRRPGRHRAGAGGRRGAPAQLQLREAAPLVPRPVPQAPTRTRRNPSRRDVHAQRL